MSLYGDTRFRNAARADTPEFASAAAMQGEQENAARQQENAQISNNLMGAGALYNEAMGDNTPLADMAARYFGVNEAGIGGATELASASPEIANALRMFSSEEEIAQALNAQQYIGG